jgi:hypothetical protein
MKAPCEKSKECEACTAAGVLVPGISSDGGINASCAQPSYQRRTKRVALIEVQAAFVKKPP